MYNVAVKREFDAQHFLIGGDWGLENESPFPSLPGRIAARR